MFRGQTNPHIMQINKIKNMFIILFIIIIIYNVLYYYIYYVNIEIGKYYKH